MGRERRRRIRRTGEAPRTTSTPAGMAGEAASSALSLGGARPASTAGRGATGHVRSDRVMARESAQMITESKRVLAISAVCFGMLAVLVVVDRLT